LNPEVIYTPGVNYVAEAGAAYWLIDAIVPYFGSDAMIQATENDRRLISMQFWRLEVEDNTAVLTARADDDVPPFIQQEIPFTDFPLKSIDIWAAWDGRRWTLYLPSEH